MCRITLFASLEIKWETRQPLDAILGDNVVMFESYTGAECRCIHAGFYSDNISNCEYVVPGRIQARHLVCVQTNPMAEVVRKHAAIPSLQPLVCFGKK